MGRRFWIGVGTLCVFLAAGLGITWGMEKIHEPAAQTLSRAAQTAMDGDMEQASALARQAHDRWEHYWNLTASVADHSPMDDIDSLFAEMEIYAQAGEQNHFAACCAQLSKLLGSMSDAHAFSWWNML